MLTKSKIDQMNLCLKSQAERIHKSNRNRIPRDSQWWFRQMRHVVNMAVEWQPTSHPQPKQSQFAL
jgi:hypothetical protein